MISSCNLNVIRACVHAMVVTSPRSAQPLQPTPDRPVEAGVVDIDVEYTTTPDDEDEWHVLALESRLRGAIVWQIEKSLTEQHERLVATIAALLGAANRGSKAEAPENGSSDRKLSVRSTFSEIGSSRTRVNKSESVASQRSMASVLSKSKGIIRGLSKEFENAIHQSQLSREERMLALVRGEHTGSTMWEFSASSRSADKFFRREDFTDSNTEYSLVMARRKLQALMQSPSFDVAMGLLVVTNTIFIGFEIDYVATHPGEAVVPLYYSIISYCYNLFFFVELVLRIVANWYEFFWDADVKQLMWNYLDLFMVSTSIIETALDVASIMGNSTGGRVDVTNVRVIRVIRVFRLIRLVRFARFVRFVRPIRMMLFSIMCTLKLIFWAMVLLAVIIYIHSILFTSAATTHTTQRVIDPDFPEITDLQKYWGSIGNSMRSLFLAVSGGISWVQIIDPLTKLDNVWTYAFLIYISFTYFAVLNVVTGIFCQAAMQNTTMDQDSMMQTFLRNKQLYTERFMEIFQNLDTIGKGVITFSDFVDKMGDEDVRNYFASLGLESADALCIFDLFGQTGAGGVNVEEFVMGCLRLKGYARSSDMVRLLHESKILMEQMEKITDHLNLSRSAQGIFDQKLQQDILLETSGSAVAATKSRKSLRDLDLGMTRLSTSRLSQRHSES